MIKEHSLITLLGHTIVYLESRKRRVPGMQNQRKHVRMGFLLR